MTDLRSQNELDQQVAELPVYTPPVVTTYTDDQLLEALGPARGAYTAPN